MYSDSARIGDIEAERHGEGGVAPGLALGPALQRLLAAPLAAVRVMLEELEAAYAGDRERALRLHATLAQVCALHRDVGALIDLAAPRRVRPLSCSVEELARSALAMLDADEQERMVLDAPAVPRDIEIDGPLFTDCLARVLAAVLSRSHGHVLLQAVCGERETVFRVREHGRSSELESSARGELSSRGASLALGLQLAERDVKRMGGGFESSTVDGAMRVAIVIPTGDRA
jgi:hypothetical protein